MRNEKRSKGGDIEIYSFFAFFDDVSPFFLTPGSIHPESDYWEGYYSGIESLPFDLKRNIRFVFVEGCEYRMPTTSGRVKYLFSFNTSGYAGKLRTEIDLPPNHSIRLSFKEKGIPYPDATTIGERLANDRSRYDWYEIISTIEPTPNLDPIKPCEIKKG
ncbi:hypothetical protein [Leptospira neocaledonica]|uniref:hypothetical protein n=1 Tax=Leptospira neocaledonica TaxID=2023192 RepID=UPI000F6469FD|nr:hypothetical protein [Leptospira neocaledonica]